MEKFSIKDIENFTGVKAHTIRIWEKRYNIVEPKRSSTGIRYYSGDDLKKLLNVTTLTNSGIKISKLSALTNEELCQLILKVEHCDADNGEKFNLLNNAMLDYDSNAISHLLDVWIGEMGFVSCTEGVIIPFLSKLGVLWQSESICPSHEHLISQVVRQKFFRIIDESKQQRNHSLKSEVYFLPQNEGHELGMLYLAAKRALEGADVIYLGPDLPVVCVETVLMNKKTSLICTHLTVSLDEKAQSELFGNLQSLKHKYGVKVQVFTSNCFELKVENEHIEFLKFKQV